jgi:hypothetical protein
MTQSIVAPGPIGPIAGPAKPFTGLKRSSKRAAIPFCGNHSPIFVVSFI